MSNNWKYRDYSLNENGPVTLVDLVKKIDNYELAFDVEVKNDDLNIIWTRANELEIITKEKERITTNKYSQSREPVNKDKIRQDSEEFEAIEMMKNLKDKYKFDINIDKNSDTFKKVFKVYKALSGTVDKSQGSSPDISGKSELKIKGFIVVIFIYFFYYFFSSLFSVIALTGNQQYYSFSGFEISNIAINVLSFIISLWGLSIAFNLRKLKPASIIAASKFFSILISIQLYSIISFGLFDGYSDVLDRSPVIITKIMAIVFYTVCINYLKNSQRAKDILNSNNQQNQSLVE